MISVCCLPQYRNRPHYAYVCSLRSCVRLCATLRTAARQAPLSTELSRQEYWSGLPFPSPADLPGPGIEPGLLHLQADYLALCQSYHHGLLYSRTMGYSPHGIGLAESWGESNM